jgi:hypothetical protein
MVVVFVSRQQNSILWFLIYDRPSQTVYRVAHYQYTFGLSPQKDEMPLENLA